MSTEAAIAEHEYEIFMQCIGTQQARFKESQDTLVYMSICLTCIAWQVLTAGSLLWNSRKWLHLAVLVNVLLPFLVVMTSLLNPLFNVSCEVRYWVAIVCVNLGGGCLQSILLYKAYICHNRSKVMLSVGSLINLGYAILIILYATLAKVDTYPDFIGNCVMVHLEWPALAKLGLDISSNVFLSFAFLSVIHRHYRMFGNSLHKSLLSSGLIFSVGVIVSNILTTILVSCRVVGGLSSDLYAFDWVITGYLLIKQFATDDKSDRVGEKEDLSHIQTSNSSVLSCRISDLHHDARGSASPTTLNGHMSWDKP
ncbi:hypothetical protein DM01DRAFT_143124 [Hesseltinella vesiculosa]|uniref:Transmembrane protein n=1 Tax=Hesseltinella vesiculosa TaxID=101127 RepID=A0A1X2GHJ1_9FUNG|nr:hypothetical protein DM01DRAFT_143124 [Hesseltinella vesiculosa]